MVNSTTSAAVMSSTARTRCGSLASIERYRTRYGTPGSGSVSGPASWLKRS